MWTPFTVLKSHGIKDIVAKTLYSYNSLQFAEFSYAELDSSPLKSHLSVQYRGEYYQSTY